MAERTPLAPVGVGVGVGVRARGSLRPRCYYNSLPSSDSVLGYWVGVRRSFAIPYFLTASYMVLWVKKRLQELLSDREGRIRDLEESCASLRSAAQFAAAEEEAAAAEARGHGGRPQVARPVLSPSRVSCLCGAHS